MLCEEKNWISRVAKNEKLTTAETKELRRVAKYNRILDEKRKEDLGLDFSASSIFCSFFWESSPQDGGYWSSIHNRNQENKK